MRKKKVLVHGTRDSVKNFFQDAISRDYEILAILNEQPEGISITHDGKEMEILSPRSLPKFVKSLIDAIIITDTSTQKHIVRFLRQQGFGFRKIILWDEKNGYGKFEFKNSNGNRVIFIAGLGINVRNKYEENFLNQTITRLQNNRIYKNMDPKLYEKALKEHFQRRTGKSLNFDNLQTFTEKLQWIKIHDATSLKSRLTDKYLVRNWVEEKIGGEYLIPLLGVWDDFDDINFDNLPDQFVLKCNHGSGMNIIVRDKNNFNKHHAREVIMAWLAFDYGMNVCLELHYSGIDRKIIAEELMTNGNLPDIDNYKFWCFNEEPLYCAVESGRSSDGSLTNLRMDFFDMNWKLTNVERNDHPHSDHPEEILPPKNFELMKELATKLAEGFAFVRVDFYEIEGRVYFGEMTFTPGGGDFSYKSEGTDEYLGSLLKLPEPTAPLVYKFV